MIGDWLPIELNNSHGISVSVLEEFGINLGKDYIKVDEYVFTTKEHSIKFNIFKPH
tara:strand:+ start:121 stop:288 length:168 start_codon:yes stop_codon:yes gene_type:complete